MIIQIKTHVVYNNKAATAAVRFQINPRSGEVEIIRSVTKKASPDGPGGVEDELIAVISNRAAAAHFILNAQ